MGDLPIGNVQDICCRKCHFLSKASTGRHGAMSPEPWSESDRFDFGAVDNLQSLSPEDLSFFSSMLHKFDVVKCYKNVWPPIVENFRYERLFKIERKIKRDRSDCVFYFEYRPEMNLKVANEHLEIEREDQRARTNQKYSRRGYLATLGSIAIAVVVFVYGLVNC